MSFAGFTALINALRPSRDAWGPAELLHLNVTVLYAFTTLFGALAAVPLAGLVGPPDGVRSLGLVMLVASTGLGIYQARRDRAVRSVMGIPSLLRYTLLLIITLQALVFLAAALTAAAQIYEAGLVLMLAVPALTFGFVVTRLGRAGPP